MTIDDAKQLQSSTQTNAASLDDEDENLKGVLALESEPDSASSPSHDEDSAELDEDFFHDAPTVEMYQSNSLFSTGLLGFLSPGSFLCINGNPVGGTIVNFAISSLFLLGPLLCVSTGLFPVPIFVASCIACASVWIYSVVKVFIEPPLFTSPLQSWAQMGIAFLTFWLPFVLFFYVSSNCIMQRTWMSNDTMQPSMQRGDIILVDKHAYWNKLPSYGELVLVEEPVRENGVSRQRAYFGRIIACPGDSVQLFGVHPVVNGKSLEQYLDIDDKEVFDHPITTYELPFNSKIRDVTEEPSGWYPILLSNQLLFSQTNSVTLDPGYYYVLEDNRDSSHEHFKASYGSIIHVSEIHGQPLYVIYNNQSEHAFERYGLRLR